MSSGCSRTVDLARAVSRARALPPPPLSAPFAFDEKANKAPTSRLPRYVPLHARPTSLLTAPSLPLY